MVLRTHTLSRTPHEHPPRTRPVIVILTMTRLTHGILLHVPTGPDAAISNDAATDGQYDVASVCTIPAPRFEPTAAAAPTHAPTSSGSQSSSSVREPLATTAAATGVCPAANDGYTACVATTACYGITSTTGATGAAATTGASAAAATTGHAATTGAAASTGAAATTDATTGAAATTDATTGAAASADATTGAAGAPESDLGNRPHSLRHVKVLPNRHASYIVAIVSRRSPLHC